MTFAEDYSKVLSPFSKKFKEAENENQRKAVLRDAAKAVTESRDLLEDKGVALPKDLQAVLFFSFLFVFCLLINNIFLNFSPSLVRNGSYVCELRKCSRYDLRSSNGIFPS
jgi:hypothetical protein